MLPLYDLLDTILSSYTSPINSFNYHSRPTDRCYFCASFCRWKTGQPLELAHGPKREEWGLTPRRSGPRVTGPYHCAKGLLKRSSLGHFPVLQFSRGYRPTQRCYETFKDSSNSRQTMGSGHLMCPHSWQCWGKAESPKEMSVGFPKEGNPASPPCLWRQLLALGKD